MSPSLEEFMSSVFAARTLRRIGMPLAVAFLLTACGK